MVNTVGNLYGPDTDKILQKFAELNILILGGLQTRNHV